MNYKRSKEAPGFFANLNNHLFGKYQNVFLAESKGQFYNQPFNSTWKKLSSRSTYVLLNFLILYIVSN